MGPPATGGRHRPGRHPSEVVPWGEDDGAIPDDDSFDALLGPEDARAEEDGADGGEARATTARVPLLSVPESLRSVDVQVGARAVRGLLLLVLVVVLVLGGRWWWVQQGADAVPVAQLDDDEGLAAQAPQDGGGSVAAAPAEDAAGQAGEGGADPLDDVSQEGPGGRHAVDPAQEGPGAPAAEPSVVVHVVGEVRRPGIVELPAGARVADAVAAVGGLTDEADQASLNLARALVDGEQVWVGAPGEQPPPGALQGAGPPGQQARGSGAQGEATGGSGAGPLDLNHATQADLEELPGIGPVTAGRVLAWREEHGHFSAVEELMEVSGIGERTFAQLEPLVTVGG